MYKSRTLLKNTILISVARISAQAVNFLFLPVYTSVLSAEEYGRVDLYITTRNILSYFIFWGMEEALFMFCVSSKNVEEKRDYFSTGVIISFIALLFFSVIYFLSKPFIRFTYRLYLFAFIVVYGTHILLLNLARGFEQLKIYAVATALATVLTVIFNLLFVIIMKSGVRGVLIGGIFAYSIVCLYLVIHIPFKKMFVFHFDVVKAKKMVNYAWPMFLNSISSWIASSSDRVIVSKILGISANGIYSLANKFFSMLVILGNGFIMAWSVAAAKTIDQPNHKEYFIKMIDFVMDILFIMISAIIVFLPFIFHYIFNEEYYDAYYHIPIIVYASLWWVMAAMVGWINVAHKRTKAFGSSTLLVGIINLAVHLLLIHLIGLFAASISTLISYFALFLFRFISLNKTEKIPFPKGNFFRQLSILFLLGFFYYMNNSLCKILGFVFFITYLFFSYRIYKADIKNLIYLVKKKLG